MALSLKQAATTTAAIAAMGLAIACGSEETAKPTGMSMKQTTAAPNMPRETDANFNSAPEIDDVVIRPTEPVAGDRVTAIFEASDPDGDTLEFDFEWTVGGLPVDNDSSELMLKDVVKGSLVQVSVTARDAHASSDSWSAEVQVANQPPVIRGIVMEPLGEITAARDVTAAPRSFDADGDEVRYQYRWTINGSNASSNGATLSSNEFSRGDTIVVEVTAHDEDDASEPLVSAPIPVVNARPRITSNPTGIGGDTFRYVPTVEDPDGDRRLRFTLASAPRGMTIDSVGGEMVWEPESDQQGSHRVHLVVSDQNGGEDTQIFELNLGYEEDSPAAAEN